MVGQELDRDHQDGTPAGGRDLGHQVGKIGLHPLPRLMASALPAERPILVRQPGFRGDSCGGRPQLAEVVRLLLGNPLGQAVGGHQDADGRAILGRKPVERCADSIREGGDERGLSVPGTRDADLWRRVAQGRPRRLDRRGISVHQQRRVLRREDDRGDPTRARIRERFQGRQDRRLGEPHADLDGPAQAGRERVGLVAGDLDQWRTADDLVAPGELVDELGVRLTSAADPRQVGPDIRTRQRVG